MIDKKIKSVYFIGIKGVAMTSLAILLKEAGIEVSGSDTKETFVTDEILKKAKINWKIGFNEKNIDFKPDLVITTGAHAGLSNPEAVAARQMGLKVITHAEALGQFMNGYFGIAVCGVGGKTTTSSIIAYLLNKSGLDSSYAVGVASINPLGFGGHFGQNKYFIAEADEYATDPVNNLTARFMWLDPQIIVITNIEYDHPDVYKNLEATKNTFLKFIDKLPEDGLVIVNGDNQNILDILPKINKQVITVGFNPNNDYQIKKTNSENFTSFEIWENNNNLSNFKTSLFGDHNILNCALSIIVALKLNISMSRIVDSLVSFKGVKRRFELITEKNGITLYDDYAHHPNEIQVTLETFKNLYPQRRLIAIFQPHTYSRTKALFSEFAQSFSKADLFILTDVYASARESPDKSLNLQDLVSRANKYKNNSKYVASLKEAINYLGIIVQKGDIIVTLGAGDIFNYHKLIISKIN